MGTGMALRRGILLSLNDISSRLFEDGDTVPGLERP